MKLTKDYHSLEETLLCLKEQVVDSIPYAQQHIPKFNSPEEVYNWLKSRTTYVNDPHGIELLQSLPTLLSGSRLGVPGGGDCDCFTIAALAALAANGFTETYVILVGRSANVPVHIYAGVEEDGEIVPFDLTNEFYGEERTNYKYQQILPFTV
jgi:hypothetical protein